MQTTPSSFLPGVPRIQEFSEREILSIINTTIQIFRIEGKEFCPDSLARWVRAECAHVVRVEI